MGRPGRVCGICVHPRVAEINSALLAGERQADVARRFKTSNNAISYDAISRHFLRHLSTAPGATAIAVVPPSAAGPVDLLTCAADLRITLMRLLKRAETARDLRTALLAIREARGLLEFHGRLTGQLDSSGVRVAVQINAGGSDATRLADARERVAAKLNALCYPGRAAAEAEVAAAKAKLATPEIDGETD